MIVAVILKTLKYLNLVKQLELKKSMKGMDIQSFEMAKTIIDNNIRKKRPKTNSIYLIESHIRVTNDSKYKKMLQELLASKEDRTKDNKYHIKNMCSSF